MMEAFWGDGMELWGSPSPHSFALHCRGQLNGTGMAQRAPWGGSISLSIRGLLWSPNKAGVPFHIALEEPEGFLPLYFMVPVPGHLSLPALIKSHICVRQVCTESFSKLA